MKKYYVYEWVIWFGEPDKLIGVYDTREAAEAVADPMVCHMNRYIVEKEEAPEK